MPGFQFIGGALCLDFINTAGGRPETHPRRRFAYEVIDEKLGAFSDLLRWSVAAGILTGPEAARAAGCRAPAAQALLRRALALREALYRLCLARIRAWTPPPADLALLNRALAEAHSHRLLGGSPAGYVWTWDKPDAPDRILWTLAQSAASFLASPAVAALRRCPGDDCGWLFLDASRNHSRQWCEMRVCGNRAKLRRFRRRHNRVPPP